MRWTSCQLPKVNHEGPLIGVLIDAEIVSTKIEEEDAVRTINLFKLCYNAQIVQQDKQSLKSWEWKEMMEKKEVNNFCADYGGISLSRESRKILADATQD